MYAVFIAALKMKKGKDGENKGAAMM